MNKLKRILCYVNIHDWEINQFVNNKGKFLHFARTCQCCSKSQILQRPKEYDPVKWVFRD